MVIFTPELRDALVDALATDIRAGNATAPLSQRQLLMVDRTRTGATLGAGHDLHAVISRFEK
jgi:hypothetical protein